MMRRYAEKLRVVWAIASKDLLDAFKNRTTLGIIISALVLVVLYRFMPQLESSDVLPRLAVYDRGSSEWIARWDVQSEFDLVEMDSLDMMERYLGHMSFPVLGLILPKDFDQIIARGDGVALEGFVIHWISEEEVLDTRSFFEGKLSEIVDQSVTFNLAAVYTRSDSRGYAFLAGVGVIFAMMMGGMFVIPHLMIEEKATRTMDSLLVSPVTYTELLIGKAFAGGVLTAIAGAIGFAVNSVIVTHWWLAVLASVTGAIFVVLVGLLLGSVMENKQQMTMWSFVLMVVMLAPAFLSTAEFLLSDEIRALLGWTPTLSLLNLTRASFAEVASFKSIGVDLSVVLGWTAVLYLLNLVVLRRKEMTHV